MRHRLYYHITWTTRDREPLISGGVAEFLSRFLPAIVRKGRGRIVALGMVTTHLHMLIRLHPLADIPRLLQGMKGGSANLAKREGHNGGGPDLRWAKGYNIESVSPRQIPLILEYISNQSRHHPDEAIRGWTGDTQVENDPIANPPVAISDSLAARIGEESPVAISDRSAEPRLQPR